MADATETETSEPDNRKTLSLMEILVKSNFLEELKEAVEKSKKEDMKRRGVR